MNETIKAAVAGCGSIAQVHAQILKDMDHVTLCAFCDIRPERAERFRGQFGTSRSGVYTSLTELLTEQAPDVVHICTPHFLHEPMAIEVLKAGRSVFLEKPPAISEKGFQELKRAEQNSPGRLGLCFQNRYNRSTQKVDELLREGKLGRVLGGRAFVTWNRTRDYYETSDWRGRLNTEGGGALINQSIHTLDLLLRWLGTPERIHASMSNFRLNGVTEVEDTVSAYLEFPGGIQGCFYASNTYIADVPVILEIGCEKGSVRLEGRDVICRYDDGSETHFRLEGAKALGKSYWGDGHGACIHDFYRCLTENRPFAQDLASAENTFETMRRIYEAAGWRTF